MKPLLLSAIALSLAAPAIAAPVFGVRQDLPGPLNPLDVAIVNLNGDSAPDLVVTSPGNPPTAGLITTWFGRGDGYFYAGPTSACMRSPEFLVAGDLNGDSISDLAFTATPETRKPNSTLQVMLGQGDGSFITALIVAPGGSFGGLRLNDLDGDGNMDLVASHAAPAILLYPGNGDGSFGSPLEIATDASAFDVEIGDLNNDGAIDLALSTQDWNRALLLGDAKGGWTGVPGADATGRSGLGHFDQDGLLDQVCSDRINPRLIVKRQGQWPYNVLLPTTTWSMLVRDFDQDGDDDLLTVTNFPGRVQFRSSRGDGAFEDPVSYEVGTRPYGLAIGDLNNDGLADLVTANNGSASVTVLLQGNPVIGTTPLALSFALAAPFPNPARGRVQLGFELATNEPCALTVHDVRGRLVESRDLAHPSVGPQAVLVFEGGKRAAGLYFVTLRQGDRKHSHSFVVLP
jgi:hypothetical protein